MDNPKVSLSNIAIIQTFQEIHLEVLLENLLLEPDRNKSDSVDFKWDNYQIHFDEFTQITANHSAENIQKFLICLLIREFLQWIADFVKLFNKVFWTDSPEIQTTDSEVQKLLVWSPNFGRTF